MSERTTVRFFFEETQLIRVVIDDRDEPWFVGVDVCRVLGVVNSHDALGRLDVDERKTLAITEGTPGSPYTVVISEAGVYRLVFASRKENAERFKRWLARDVLHSIRKTGTYDRHHPSRINIAALNAVTHAVGEVRRSLGARVAAEALPGIFAKAGVTIPRRGPPQGEFDLKEPPDDPEDED
jgi:prophage antirepressor-like protein